MKTILLTLCLALISVSLSAQSKLGKKHYRIYSTKQQKEISLKDLISEVSAANVLIYGESHNDSVTHFLEVEIFKALNEEYGDVAVSLEMFTSETQPIVDEYLAGTISEHHFTNDARSWPNYADYRPMVEYAKEKGLQVIAANAPFRYVRLANRKGQNALLNVDPYFRNALAPIPYDTAVGAEYEFLLDIMSYSTGDSTAPKQILHVNQGQSLWNATMAYSIVKYYKAKSDRKIYQVSGKFHSDNGYGIVNQLKIYEPNLNVMTISAESHDDFPKVDYSQFEGVADFIIITDPKVPTTY